MSPWETVGACLAAGIVLVLLATYGWDAWHKPRTDRRFQRTARQAARTPHTEVDVRRDQAKARAARRRDELAEWQAFNRIIDREFGGRIPHQTRWTEDPQ